MTSYGAPRDEGLQVLYAPRATAQHRMLYNKLPAAAQAEDTDDDHENECFIGVDSEEPTLSNGASPARKYGVPP